MLAKFLVLRKEYSNGWHLAHFASKSSLPSCSEEQENVTDRTIVTISMAVVNIAGFDRFDFRPASILSIASIFRLFQGVVKAASFFLEKALYEDGRMIIGSLLEDQTIN